MSFIRRPSHSSRSQSLAADLINRWSGGLAHDNFEYIAMNAGVIWAVLNQSHIVELPSEDARLAACAYLVLYTYLEQGRLSVDDVELAMLCARQGTCSAGCLDRAHESQSMEMILFGAEDGIPNPFEPRILLNLTLQLEVLAFCADNDEMLPEDWIINTVIDKKAVVARVLIETDKAIKAGRLQSYEPMRSFAAGVLASQRFSATMKEIGTHLERPNDAETRGDS